MLKARDVAKNFFTQIKKILAKETFQSSLGHGTLTQKKTNKQHVQKQTYFKDILKLICHSLQEGLDRPTRSLDRWLSHQLSSQLT